ncbi:hypothetical protein [Natrinema sp. DC36]|uniref:hypothetical protein n=1 Tax=Natrinema sp. DC36 TaxID=2878680 RepID=UPI001CEFF714|nr:hypothetical protein [Natrinema sp. DC36]
MYEPTPQDRSRLGEIVELAVISLLFARQLAVAGLGGSVVALPWMGSTLALSSGVSAIGGEILAALAVMAFLMVTVLPAGFLALNIIMRLDMIVPGGEWM